MIYCGFITLIGIIFIILTIKSKLEKQSLESINSLSQTNNVQVSKILIRKVFVFKMISSLLFVLSALIAFIKYSSNDLCVFLLIYLILSALGDIFLGLRNISPKIKTISVYLGCVAFTLAHIIYSIGMIIQYSSILSLIPLAPSLICSLIFILTEKVQKVSYKKMKPIALVYATILSYSLFISVWMVLFEKFSVFYLLLLLSKLSFIFSDMILSQLYFGIKNHKISYTISNYILYYLGQYLIGFAIIFSNI